MGTQHNKQNIREAVVDNISIVSEIGDLDMYAVEQSKDAWRKIIEKGSHLIIDLSETTYIEAHSFWVLVKCYRYAMEKNTKLGIIPSRSVSRLLGMSPYPAPFSVFQTMEEAIKSFAEA